MDWIYIDYAILPDDVEQVHVDTRDFHVISTSDKLDTRDGKHRELTKVMYKPEYTMSKDEILPFVKRIEIITGGKGSWRFMNFQGISDPVGWFKYIRFYKMKNGKFVVCSRDGNPVDWTKMTEENLETEHLNLIKKS